MKGVALSCSFLYCAIEDVQDAVAETRKVVEPKSVAFEYLNLVVAALGKTVSVCAAECVENHNRPAYHCICATDDFARLLFCAAIVQRERAMRAEFLSFELRISKSCSFNIAILSLEV